MRVTEKEMENVIRLKPFDRYMYFIKRIADAELIYSLKDDDGWAIAEVGDYKLFSVWSAKEFALLSKTDEWLDYNPTEISLQEFEENIIPLIVEKKYLINVFSVNSKTGFIVELGEFLRDLEEELKKYE
jgi:hypothetical protein